MGIDKTKLLVQGETLAARAARVLATVCDPVVEVGPGVTTLHCVREEPAGAGPLAALVAGARALGATPLVLLACDMPFVEVPLLQMIAFAPGDGTVVPVADGRLQYSCARYGAAAIASAVAAVHGGDLALKRAVGPKPVYLEEHDWRKVAPEHAFADLDTPADLTRFGFEGRR